MIYIDLLVIEDLLINYIILFSTAIILNRITKFKNIFLSSVTGTIPLVFLFLNINSIIIFIINFIFSIIMSIIAFKYKDFLYTIKNIVYMYFISMFLSGTLYLLNIKTENHLVNSISLMFIITIISYIYIKCMTSIKNNYSNYYQIDIYLKDKPKITLTAYLDTGNKLIDPYTHSPIVLVTKKNINITKEKVLLVPYNTIDSSNILKCIKPEKVFIKGIGYNRKVLIGLIDNITVEGAECLLGCKVLERKIWLKEY